MLRARVNKPLPKLDPVKQLLLDQLLARIRALPMEQQLDATLALARVFAEGMKIPGLLEVRAEALDRWSHIPEFIDLIDGQLAARDLRTRKGA